MTLELATNLTYACLGLAFLILCTTFWILWRARKHLAREEAIAAKRSSPMAVFNRPTLKLPDNYHEGS